MVWRRDREGPSPRSGDGGFTLVEMLVALLLIGIIFSGAAAALINLSRASVSNERRVQATALITELHERFQAMSWDAALLYPEEIGQLAGLDGYAVVDGTHEFDDRPIALYEGDCDPSAACRWDEIPSPFEEAFVDGRRYEVYRIVTEVDRAGTPEGEIKRLTTVVRFEVRGRWITQQLDSERAGSSSELGLPSPPGPAFNIVPSTVPLDEDGFHTASIRFDAVFPPEMATTVQNVTATIQTVGGPVTLSGFETPVFTQLIRRYTLDVGAEPEGSPITFAIGTQSVTWTYDYESNPYEATTQLTFDGPSDDPLDPDPSAFDGKVQNLVASAGPIRVRRQGGGASTNYFLCDDLTITATVVDIDPAVGDRVRAEYTPDSGAATNVELLPQGGSSYAHTFAAGSSSPWYPPDTGTSETFVVTARGGQGSPPPFSDPRDVTVNFDLVGSCPS